MAQTAETMEAGRALDALIAERVMGKVLTVPRERALAIVGACHVRATGRVFTLDVRGEEIHVRMPSARELAGHESDDNVNQRYFRFAAEHLLALGGEIAAEIEREVAACRLPAEPYSTAIAAAWLVVEKMRDTTDDDETFVTLTDCGALGWRCSLDYNLTNNDALANLGVGLGETAPLAICRAALLALDAVSTPTGAPHDAQ